MGDNSRITARCCGSTCPYESDDFAQPCWGRVSCVDEYYDGEDSYWVHACEGHEPIMVWGTEYEPPPEEE